MLESNNSNGEERRDEGHDHWLAMQSAYEEYRRAAEALDCVHESADDLSPNEHLRLTTLEGRQRVAFERYVEARLAFLEFRFDESNDPDSGEVSPLRDAKYSGIRSWLTFAQRLVLPILAIMLLSASAFSFVREQKRVHDLEAAREELRVTRDQTRNGLDLLGKKLDGLELSARPGAKQLEHSQRDGAAAGSGANEQQPLREKELRRLPAVHTQPRQIAAKGKPLPQARVQGIGTRTYGAFSLVPSRQFKRIGPVDVSVRAVDVQHKGVSLLVVSGHVRTEVPHLQQNQPLWIKMGDHQQPLGLVIDRIAKNRLDGHLIRAGVDKQQLAANRLKSRLVTNP
jgi:hypothetical protein